MATDTLTFSPPETVTIPGEIALEAVALLDAYVELMADFRLDGETDPFCTIEDSLWRVLVIALGQDLNEDLTGPLWDTVQARSADLKEQIRNCLDGPALGAITATKMAHDISEVKARLELSYA